MQQTRTASLCSQLTPTVRRGCAAQFSVLTRLKEPENSSIYSKLRVYDGEGHGFRKAENIQDSAAAELSFYGQVWGFTPAGDIPVLPVENL